MEYELILIRSDSVGISGTQTLAEKRLVPVWLGGLFISQDSEWPSSGSCWSRSPPVPSEIDDIMILRLLVNKSNMYGSK